MTPPLSRLRVLDLSNALSGNYPTKMLVDAGADVLKIEPPGGDPLRTWSAAGVKVDPNVGSVLYRFLHAGKASKTLSLEQPYHGDTIRETVAAVDVIVDTFTPGTIEHLVKGFDQIHSINRQATLVSISHFGHGGGGRGRGAQRQSSLFKHG